MMIRTALGMGAVMLGVLVAAAQSDPIAQRKGLMKKNNEHARELRAMTRGEQPFDAAKVNAAFTQWADTAKVLPTLFPDSSKTGGDTRALPKIWETKADFDAKDAAFAKAVADSQSKVKDLDALKVAFPEVSKACDNCHESYRRPQQR
jgi:cytochrome c556